MGRPAPATAQPPEQTVSAGSAAWARHRIRAAARFLGWLDRRQVILAELTQADVDAWLVGYGNATAYNIELFIDWLEQRRLLVHKITVPARPRRTTITPLDRTAHHQQLHRCLTDTTLPTDLRCAAILVLLYGQMTGRLVTLTVDRLTDEGDKMFLRIDKQLVRLPPRVAGLFRSLRQQRIPSVIGRAADAANIWLFPGHQPGRHHGAAAMARRLRQAGFDPATARLTALIDMTEDLPSPIAAALLGYDVQTTDKFAKITQRDWAPYLQERVL